MWQLQALDQLLVTSSPQNPNFVPTWLPTAVLFTSAANQSHTSSGSRSPRPHAEGVLLHFHTHSARDFNNWKPPLKACSACTTGLPLTKVKGLILGRCFQNLLFGLCHWKLLSDLYNILSVSFDRFNYRRETFIHFTHIYDSAAAKQLMGFGHTSPIP